MPFEPNPDLDVINEDDYINCGKFIGVTTSVDGKRAALAFEDPGSDDPLIFTIDVETLNALYACFDEMLVRPS